MQVHVNSWCLSFSNPIPKPQHAPTPCSFVVFSLDSPLNPLRSFGVCQNGPWFMCVAHYSSDESYGSPYNLRCNKQIYCRSLHHIHVVYNIIHWGYCTSCNFVQSQLQGCCPKSWKCFQIVGHVRGRTPRHMQHKHKYHKIWLAFAWTSSHFHNFKFQTFTCLESAKGSHWLLWASMWLAHGALFFQFTLLLLQVISGYNQLGLRSFQGISL
jgi:hypothetical protein